MVFKTLLYRLELGIEEGCGVDAATEWTTASDAFLDDYNLFAYLANSSLCDLFTSLEGLSNHLSHVILQYSRAWGK